MKQKKVYLASPLNQDKREAITLAKGILEAKGFEVYSPVEHIIPNAWDYPNDEWGLMVFTNDYSAITDSDIVVILNYGREGTTLGTGIEQGIAFEAGIKVILVEMTEDVQSLMAANARYATVKGLEGLESYDFDTLPQTRTSTEQK